MLNNKNTDADRLQHLLSRTRTTNTGCREFQGCIQSNGYGRAKVRGHTDYAHRHAYRLAKGAIAEELTPEQRAQIAKRVADGHVKKEIAAEFGISRPHVGYVAKKEGARSHVIV